MTKKLKKIGPYTVKMENSRSGGNSTIYEIVSPTTDPQTVLKLITKQDMRAKNEIETLIELRNLCPSSVLPVFDYSIPEIPTEDDPVWFTMPYAKVLKDCKDLMVEESVAVMLQVSQCLQKLRSVKENFLHRDIKPGNIFCYNGKWILGDFGLATHDEAKDLTGKSDLIGSRCYMADEVIENNKNATEKSEVFSLAKTMWMVVNNFNTKYPPSGHLIAGNKKTNLSFRHTNPKIKNLDIIIDRATLFNTQERLGLNQFILELESWLNPAWTNESVGIFDISNILKRISDTNISKEELENSYRTDINFIEDDLVAGTKLKFKELLNIDTSNDDAALQHYIVINRPFESSPVPGKYMRCATFRYKGLGDYYFLAGIGYRLIDTHKVFAIAYIYYSNCSDISQSIFNYQDMATLEIGMPMSMHKHAGMVSDLINKIPEHLEDFLKWTQGIE